MTQRTMTGIDGLDKALNGGIPSNNVVLISGGAGTGKSTLCLQYLVNGATKYNEKGIYLSTEQTKKELYKTGESYGWNLEQLEAQNKIKVMYFDVVETDGFLEKIYEAYTTFQPKRVVIDSLTTLTDSLLVTGADKKQEYSMAKIADKMLPVPTSERIVSKNLLYHLMKKLRLFDATTLLTSELIEGQDGLSADQISEFICDGVIILDLKEIAKKTVRSLKIRKMRNTSHELDSFLVTFDSNGFTVEKETVFAGTKIAGINQ